MRFAAAILLLAVLSVAPAQASIVNVTVTGQVVFNAVDRAPLNGVVAGTDVVMSFQVDSEDYVDGLPGVTRGYAIDPVSFTLVFDSLVQIGLQDPFPNDETPFFTLVDGTLIGDAFFVSMSNLLPNGVPLSEEPFSVDLDLQYDGDALDSLDILDAQGVYDFDGLRRYTFDLWAVTPGNVVMGINFGQMTISTPTVPVPAGLWLMGSALVGLIGVRRRR
jgi:hypothetical protein